MINIIPWSSLPCLKENEFAICFDDDGMIHLVKKSEQEGYFISTYPESKSDADRSFEDINSNKQSLNSFKSNSFMVISKEILKELINKYEK